MLVQLDSSYYEVVAAIRSSNSMEIVIIRASEGGMPASDEQFR